MIKNYYEFINEGGKPTTFDNLSDVLGKLPYTWDANDLQVYKGLGREKYNGESFYYELPQSERMLKGWMSFTKFLPSWKDFGWHRQSSVIATTDLNESMTWGIPYIVVPLENYVYVSNGSDFNYTSSWNFFLKEFEKSSGAKTGGALSVVNYVIINTLVDFSKSIGVLSEVDYIIPINKYTYIFKNIDMNIDKLNETFSDSKNANIKFVLDGINEHKGIINFLDYLFDPIKNGFVKMKYTDLIEKMYEDDEYSSNEVWFPSDCIFINENDFLKFKD